VRAIHIVGRKKSGKTSLILRLLPLLRACGLRVGTVKHTRQSHALDVKETDSWKHRQAGAEATLVLSPQAGALHFTPPKTTAELNDLLQQFLGEMDLVLVEGWKEREGRRIEVLGADQEGLRLPLQSEGHPGLLAVVLGPSAVIGPAHPIDPALPAFEWEDTEGIAAVILDWLRGTRG